MQFDQLLKGVRNLDGGALAQFMAQYSPLIMAFIARRVHKNDVEDATQEFLFHILKTNLFAKFGGETEDAFKAYLVKSALHFSYDWRAKEVRINAPLDIFDAENPRHWNALSGNNSVHTEFERKEIARRLNAALAALPDPERKIMELKLLEYSLSEIAQLVDEPLGSVNSWYTRTLKKLAEELKDLHIFSGEGSVIE